MIRERLAQLSWWTRIGLLYATACAAWFVVQPLRALRHMDSALWDPIAAARILGTGSRCLYSCPQLAHDQASAYLHMFVIPGSIQYLDPPPVAFLLQPLAGINAKTTLVIFMMMAAACVAVAGWLLYRHVLPDLTPPLRLTVVMASLTTLPATYGFRIGQWTPILILPAVAALVSVAKGRQFLGGLLLSVLLIKPQLIWLLPVVLVLIAARQWRVLVGLATGAIFWLAGSILILGFDHIWDWPAALLDRRSEVDTTDGLPGLVSFLTSSTNAGLWCAAVAVVVVVAIVIWRNAKPLRENTDIALGVGVAVSLVTAPHVFAYDLVLLALPLCIWARRQPVAALITTVVMSGLQFLAGVNTDGFIEHLEVIGPLAVTIGLLLSLYQSGTSTPGLNLGGRDRLPGAA